MPITRIGRSTNGGNLRQRCLCQQIRVKPSIKVLLFGSIEGLPQGRNYLKTIINRLAAKEVDQLLPQRLSEKANCKFSTYQLYSANGQAYSQAYYQVETRSTSQQHK